LFRVDPEQRSSHPPSKAGLGAAERVNRKEKTLDEILVRGVITKSILRIYFSCHFGVYLSLGGGEIE
jgi:hypothetical protein